MPQPIRISALLFAAISACCALPGCASRSADPAPQPQPAAAAEPAPPAQEEEGLAELKKLMVGSFSSKAQSEADPDFFDIRLHMTEIWADGTDVNGFWLYVEQATAASPDRPYRQRIYHVFRKFDHFYSEVYTLPGNALDYAGAWKNPAKVEILGPASILPIDGCNVKLTRTGKRTFAGSTEGTLCPSSRDGASYTTSEVEITPAGLITLDRGYDAAGKQVWGSTKGGYRFNRVQE